MIDWLIDRLPDWAGWSEREESESGWFPQQQVIIERRDALQQTEYRLNKQNTALNKQNTALNKKNTA